MDPINPQMNTEEKTKHQETDAHQKNNKGNDSYWAKDSLEKIATAGITEQRRKRRWGIFFKFVFFAYLFSLIGVFYNKKNIITSGISNEKPTSTQSHTALVRLNGVIAAGQPAGAEYLSKILHKAAQSPRSKNILIMANSPCGSPVQSSIIYKAIQQLKIEYPKKKIVTVISDTCASGCYYIASAADEIYADKSSIVGSIGVISHGMGYQEAAKKIGITPRTFTAGKYKDFLSSSREVTPYEQQHMQKLLDNLHKHFIDAVKTGRGDKLVDDENLFTGLFWDGETALTLGLIDGIATPDEVIKKLGGLPVYDYTPSDPFEEIIKKFGLEATDILSETIQKTIKESINGAEQTLQSIQFK